MNKTIQLIIKVVVSVGLLALLFKLSGPENIINSISGCDVRLLLVAFCMILIGTFLAAYRWFTVMNILGFSGGVVFYIKSYFKGVFFNQLLPSSIGGDAFRIIDVSRLGYKKRYAFVGVLIDRGLGVFGVFVVNIVFNNLLPGLLPDVIYRGLNIISAIGIAGFAAFAFIHKIPFLKKYSWFSVLAKPSEDLYIVLNTPFRFAAQLVLTVAVHMFTFAGVFFIAMSLGAELSVSAFMVLMPPVILLTIIPVSLAGWGIREGAMVGLLGFVGVSKDIAMSISIVYGFCYVLQGVAGFYFWLRSDKIKGKTDES